MSASSSASLVSCGSRMVSWCSPASSHALPFMRTYVADAGLLPTRTAARPGWTPRAARARISVLSSARIAPPMAVPSISLAGKVHRARLADHHDLDLARILEVALDLARDLLGELARLAVVDRGGGNDHAHLSAGLDREHLLHARELGGDLLELGEPFDVGLEGLAPRTRSRPRNRDRKLHDHADRALVRHVVVMRRDTVDDRRMLTVLGRDFDAELHVGAVVLVREDLADVVQERPALRELRVEFELGRDDPCEPRDFLRVLEDVLPVRRTIAHPPDQLHQLRVHPLDASFVDRLLARLRDRRLD